VTRGRRGAPSRIPAELLGGPPGHPALRLTSEVLWALFDGAPMMIALWDASRRLLLVNRQWEQALGWTLEEAQRIDLAVATFPDPRHRRRAIELYRRADHRWVNTRPHRRDGTTLDRILQEALTNAARHSGATAVEIRLCQEAGRVLLEVADNGRGIADDRIAASSSLGLLGMRERARLLGGEVTIRGNPGAGTTVAVILPR